jgi:hypothetical protein
MIAKIPAVTLVAILAPVVLIFIYWDRRRTKTRNRTFEARPSQCAAWEIRFPGQQDRVETFLRLFCHSFGAPLPLWNRFSPDDSVNVYFDRVYKSSFWCYDNLEHAEFLMGVVDMIGKPIPDDAFPRVPTLGEVFDLMNRLQANEATKVQ